MNKSLIIRLSEVNYQTVSRIFLKINTGMKIKFGLYLLQKNCEFCQEGRWSISDES